jgi:hypothetical protein
MLQNSSLGARQPDNPCTQPRPRAVLRLPTADPSVVTLARRAHAGMAVPQAPEALTGSPELPSLGDRGTLGSQRPRQRRGGRCRRRLDNRSRR